jgi:hypothetical protein
VSAEDRALTDSVIVAGSEFQKAEPVDRPKALARLEKAAKQRLPRMLRLMEDNPGQFLKTALPRELRDSMPASVQANVEYETEIEGVAYVLHEDKRDGSRYLYFLQGTEGDIAVHFAEKAPVLQTGSRVKVKGVKLNKALAVGADTGSVQVLAATTPLIAGAQATAVIMVNFSDKPSSYSASQIRQVVFTTTSDFHKENSYQQAWLSGDVYGPYTIAMSSGVCDFNGLATQARSAASAAGVSLSAFKRFVYVFPQNACGWWGLGTIGGNPSHAWINGTVVLQVVGHEMGHNYGLYHSHALECGSVTIGTSCSNIEYGDTLDIMGTSNGHYDAYQKERLGWLNTIGAPPITTATTGGQYLLDAYEPTGTTPKALKVLKSTDGTGKKTWYYVEYRQPIGFDAFLSSNTNVRNGVVIHTGSETSPDTSFLLDMTPETASWSDPALTTSKTYQDQQAGISIGVAWVTSTTAAVNVTTGGGACVRATPALAVTPLQGVTTQAGNSASYTLTVTNKDSSACTAAAFSITSTPPSGWSVIPGASPLTINPGASASTSVMVTSPSGTADGSYDMPIVVTNNVDSAQSASITARYIVATICSFANPTVTLSPKDSGPVAAGTKVVYTVTILNDNSSGCTAKTFNLKLSKPLQISGSFSPVTVTLASGATGTAFLTVSSTTKAAIRSYTFTVTAVNTSKTAFKASDTATYTVGNTLRK